MPKGLFFATFALSAAATLVCAAQSGAVKEIHVGNAPADSGRQMYASYCASCHGMDGRGNGPVAADLKTQPTDLTQLARRNHGKYPDVRVISVLKQGTSVPAHGNAVMPVWGPILNATDANSRLSALRISNLSGYLESIQAK
ncbi:MAG TPA: c-type cytochrome [Terracidiphilus sp.]